MAPDLAAETVRVWVGLYEDHRYVEHQERRFGPDRPLDGAIPFPQSRRFNKTRTPERADRIEP